MSGSGSPLPLRVFSGADVRRLMPVATCIDVIATTMRAVSEGQAALPLRTAMRIPGTENWLGLMPGYLADPRGVGAKILSLFPGNPAQGRSSHMGMVALFDTETGAPIAILPAAETTAVRTAAASALATRTLSNEGAGDLAILGTGEQAACHLEAMSLVRNLRRVRVWGRTKEHAVRFAEAHASKVVVPIEIAESAEAAVRDADLICTVTAASTPILKGGWVADGAHLNLVGASNQASSEVDVDLVERSRYFVDFRASTLAQAGELKLAIDVGRVTADHIVAEIGEVLGGRRMGRRRSDEVTVYKSLGIAAQDLAVARVVYDRGVASGQGVAAVL